MCGLSPVARWRSHPAKIHAVFSPGEGEPSPCGANLPLSLIIYTSTNFGSSGVVPTIDGCAALVGEISRTG